MAKAGPREKIQLRSTGVKKDGKSTGYFKTTFKNKRNTTEKLALNKFDPFAWNEEKGKHGKVVEFKEKKISK